MPTRQTSVQSADTDPLELAPSLRRSKTGPLEQALQTAPSLRRTNTDPLPLCNDEDADARRAAQSARRRPHPESARAVDQSAGAADLSLWAQSKFARAGAVPSPFHDDGGMALMAGIMLEDATCLDKDTARAKALETKHGRTRGGVELVSMDHDHSHEKGAAACAASILLAVSTPSPEHGAGTDACAAKTGAITEFIDANGWPAAVKSTLAALKRATDAQRELSVMERTGGHLRYPVIAAPSGRSRRSN